MATISLRPVVLCDECGHLDHCQSVVVNDEPMDLCDECLYDYALAADRPENGEQ